MLVVLYFPEASARPRIADSHTPLLMFEMEHDLMFGAHVRGKHSGSS